jgi:hypothetical protein
LWVTIRIIFGVHINIADAGLRSGMVRRRVPDAIQQSILLNFSTFIQRQLAAEPLGSSPLELTPPN